MKKTMYVCDECGNESQDFLSWCPKCENFDTYEIVEVKEAVELTVSAPIERTRPAPLSSIEKGVFHRISSGLNELDRVLGGGMVTGSIVAISGDPGSGKSTLSLQWADGVVSQGYGAFIASGEENPAQIKMRGDRLQIQDDLIHVQSETVIESIISWARDLSPALLVIDSVQTCVCLDHPIPGTVNTIRSVTAKLMRFVKNEFSGAVLLIVHRTKDGSIAGPKMLEHMVDAVFHMGRDGERRVLTQSKNRFGSIEEMGFFRMEERGLIEDLPNFTHATQEELESPGRVISMVKTESRSIFVEVRAMVSPCDDDKSVIRRYSGVESSRMGMILSILSKRGFDLSDYDVFIEMSGLNGISRDQNSCDLAIAIALMSSMWEIPMGNTLAVGEITILGTLKPGGIRSTSQGEIQRHGFDQILMPSSLKQLMSSDFKAEINGFTRIETATKWMGKQRRQSRVKDEIFEALKE